MSEIDLDFLQKHINQFEIRLEKYNIPDLNKRTRGKDGPFYKRPEEQFPCYQDVPYFAEPKVCSWDFMCEKEVRNLLSCHEVGRVRKLLDEKLCHNYPKAGPKMTTVDLLYSVLKFAQSSEFSVLQTACLLSIFYLIHRSFTISYTSTAEDVFYMFKDYLVHNSVEFLPNYEKRFEVEDAYKIFNYFCKLYLRHLPLIRLLSLPNFDFELNLTVDPIPVFKKKRKDGNEKKKKKK